MKLFQKNWQKYLNSKERAESLSPKTNNLIKSKFFQSESSSSDYGSVTYLFELTNICYCTDTYVLN